MKPITHYTCKLTDAQAAALEACLKARNFAFRTVPYARFAAEKDGTQVVFYNSGKLVVQGKGTEDFIQFLLEPEVLKEARFGYETVLNPELLAPRIGVDESGKGDFFGPLCVAGVYVNETILRGWQPLGIRDSKNIGSDRRIAELARQIRTTRGCVTNVVAIGNEAYSRLHAKMGNVNAVLAWAHARVIENLLARHDQMQPPPVRAISDQFATSKDVIARALMARGRGLELVQRHKAEEDLAVAAASILARDEFLRRLAVLEKKFGCEFPRGAGPAVDEAARRFVEVFGPERLGEVAKLHFRTALRAQGLPEPPKTDWGAGRSC
ncbi:MAG: ribonuclease HIII [Verrucomicrobiales bacterium]|nr:ribonuclease HIII [Verrucomicrobiales bacterium]